MSINKKVWVISFYFFVPPKLDLEIDLLVTIFLFTNFY